jgi:hypothetical protein
LVCASRCFAPFNPSHFEVRVTALENTFSLHLSPAIHYLSIRKTKAAAPACAGATVSAGMVSR